MSFRSAELIPFIRYSNPSSHRTPADMLEEEEEEEAGENEPLPLMSELNLTCHDSILSFDCSLYHFRRDKKHIYLLLLTMYRPIVVRTTHGFRGSSCSQTICSKMLSTMLEARNQGRPWLNMTASLHPWTFAINVPHSSVPSSEHRMHFPVKRNGVLEIELSLDDISGHLQLPPALSQTTGAKRKQLKNRWRHLCLGHVVSSLRSVILHFSFHNCATMFLAHANRS